MLKRLLVIAATVGAAATVAAQTPIVIHHIGPQTGVLAASNQETLSGAKLYLTAFNARGGVQGRPVTMEVLDDGQDPKRAAELLAGLVADRKVTALLLPRTTPSFEAMLPLVTQHGIAVVGPQAGPSFVNQPPKREVFTLRASYQAEAEAAIRQQHAIGVRKIALLLADDAFGRDTMVGIERVMKELQITPVASAKIDNRKPDVTDAVRTLLAQQPQAVLMITSSKAAIDFAKAYRAQGGRCTYITLSNTSNNDYLQGLGEQGRGAIVMQVMPSPYSAKTALAREFAAEAAKTKLPVSYAALYGFASAKLLTIGLQRAGNNPTSASLILALEGLGEIDLGGHRLRYGPGERTGSTYVDSALITLGSKFLR
jgi:branched-chain amino acid transport system substrate-binding protein